MIAVACSSCRRESATKVDGSSRSVPSAGSVTATYSGSASVSPPDFGAPRPGMAWIPPGVLLAGTPPGRTPRVPDEEMPGSPVEMGGFYIDLLPWPNEPNAIPTSNVSRDEAEQLCASKDKRLCTELEWERACKGPDNTAYEYGNTYRKDVCGTGIALEQASRRPTGEHAQCKSGFGVLEMHGGVWEWTSSAWGRGSKDAAQGVLRGGNSVAGELVGRCSNAIARSPSKKSPTMGLRCCAGPKNEVEVSLSLLGTPGLTMGPSTAARAWISTLESTVDAGGASIDAKSLRAWMWNPAANERLVVTMGCTTAPRACGLVVGRPKTSTSDAGVEASTSDVGRAQEGVLEDAPGDVLASASTGKDVPEIARNGDARHLRIRSLDQRGVFSRDITYVYGRVDIGAPKRP